MTSSLQGLHSLLSPGQTLRPAAPPPARAAAAAPARAAAAAELSALFSRRAFALGGAFLPFLAAPPPIAAGEMLPVDEGNGPEEISQKLFLDISIDGEPAGRIVIGLYGAAVPGGAARFASLVSGEAGASYRRKPFTKIMPGYVLHGGVVSYSGGAAVDALLGEWEAAQQRRRGTGNLAAAVGIVVRDPSMPPPKLKLVAKKGKLEIDEEEVGTRPNGTEFVISTKDSPELDESSLVVGRVLAGMEVVERIAAVKTVKENSSSPYFRAAKLIGDKRAVVAERGFNRPYSKVLVTNCGLLD